MSDRHPPEPLKPSAYYAATGRYMESSRIFAIGVNQVDVHRQVEALDEPPYSYWVYPIRKDFAEFVKHDGFSKAGYLFHYLDEVAVPNSETLQRVNRFHRRYFAAVTPNCSEIRGIGTTRGLALDDAAPWNTDRLKLWTQKIEGNFADYFRLCGLVDFRFEADGLIVPANEQLKYAVIRALEIVSDKRETWIGLIAGDDGQTLGATGRTQREAWRSTIAAVGGMRDYQVTTHLVERGLAEYLHDGGDLESWELRDNIVHACGETAAALEKTG